MKGRPASVSELEQKDSSGMSGGDAVIEQHIARRIRQLRSDRSLTLQQVSERTGLSRSLLSKIQNCIVSPPIATLSKLATALGVPIAEFFETDETEPGGIFFPKEKRKHVDGRRSQFNYEYELLVPSRKRRDMQPMLVSVDGATYKFALRDHPGAQFIFMLEGAMDYVVGDKTYALESEDCLYFDARILHGPKLKKKQIARYIVVFSGG
jgi:transcriptional regulator with XRE-family HTH domain